MTREEREERDRWEQMFAERKRTQMAFNGALELDDTAAATALVTHAHSAEECEYYVCALLDNPWRSELLRLSINQFLILANPLEHDAWVHSLSHFSKVLWVRRETEFLFDLYKTAFDPSANERRPARCLDRLVVHYALYAEWQDAPARYHLTSKSLGFVDMSFGDPLGWALHRIRSSPFATAVHFVEWHLSNPRGLSRSARETPPLSLVLAYLGDIARASDEVAKKRVLAALESAREGAAQHVHREDDLHDWKPIVDSLWRFFRRSSGY